MNKSTEDSLNQYQELISGTDVAQLQVDIGRRINEMLQNIHEGMSFDSLSFQISQIDGFIKNNIGNKKIDIWITDLKTRLSLKFNAFEFVLLKFRNCTFDDFTNGNESIIFFDNCTFKDVKLINEVQQIRFKDCSIGRVLCPDGSNIKNLVFEGGRINDLNLGFVGGVNKRIVSFCAFSGVKVGSAQLHNISFQNSLFSKVTFEKAPSFMGSTISRTVHFEKCIFKEFNRNAGAYYKQLRALAHENNDDLCVTEFNSYYLKSRHVGLEFPEDGMEFILSHCYQVINGFGLDIYKPGKLLLQFWPISYTIFFMMLGFNMVYKTGCDFQWDHFSEAFYLSFATIIWTS